MTDVRLKTETEYENAKEAVRRYLLAEYEPADISPDLIPDTKGRWRSVWEIVITSQTGDHKIWLAVPFTFPDVMPSIFLPEASSYKIPHLNHEKSLCTFDNSEVQPNSDRPVGIIWALIEKAKNVLDDGTLIHNEQEYKEEFEAYWESNAKVKTLSLVKITNKSKKIHGIRLDPAWNDFQMLFTDSVSDGKEWLANVGASYKKDAETILFLPINDFGLPPYPDTNGQIYHRLRKYDPNALSILLNHLAKSPRPAAVLFALNVNQSNPVLGAWWHQMNYHQVFKGTQGVKRYSNVVPGFSAKSLSVKHELSEKYSAVKIVKSRVERADADRIFTRTSGFKPESILETVNVIGCGSVGSNLAARLADTGSVNKFRLIDPENLKIENIARHYCGMSDVNQSKPSAVAGKLKRHYPHLNCEQYNKSVLELLRNESHILLPSDLTIVAVAELAVERRINKISRFSEEFNFPHCYIWVEPHLIGGHAVFVQNDGGCLECAFDEFFRFKYRVISNPELFSMREAGCRTGYTPYGMLELQEFISALTRFILTATTASSSQIFTWIGNLHSGRRLGVSLEAQWQTFDSFSTKITTLNKKPGCGCS